MILILEDDTDINESLKEILENNGYKVISTKSVSEFKSAWKQYGDSIRLFLIDVKLPDGNGFDVCRLIRQENSTPVIFLTSYDDEESIVKGLNIGGDDYITKPFKMNVLLSRIAANIRRFNLSTGSVYQKGDIQVDFDKYKITKNGTELNVSTKEFEIIKLLIENKGRVVRRNYLYEQIWDNHGNFVEYNTLTVAMSRIKAKLGTYGQENKPYIETLRNVGYRWIE
jgi:DNA-binding response OmpR family regulator